MYVDDFLCRVISAWKKESFLHIEMKIPEFPTEYNIKYSREHAGILTLFIPKNLHVEK